MPESVSVSPAATTTLAAPPESVALKPAVAHGWDARADFQGPARPPEKTGKPVLSPWEKYAQVLLLANELVFVD